MIKTDYKTKYPYTKTIAFLSIIVISFLIYFSNGITWIKFIKYTLFNLCFGLAQIHGMQNIANIQAWKFPKGSALLKEMGFKFKNIIAEDILFIPICSTLFYAFMYLISDIPDFLRNENFIKYGLCFFLIIEALIYQSAGKGARILMIAFTLTPLCVLKIFGFDFSTINITHAFFTFLFVIFVNCFWEYIGTKRKHWVYNKDCTLFGKGWVLNGCSHVTIFFQFPISGFVVVYYAYNFL